MYSLNEGEQDSRSSKLADSGGRLHLLTKLSRLWKEWDIYLCTIEKKNNIYKIIFQSMDLSVEVTVFTSGTEGIAVRMAVAGGGWDSEKKELEAHSAFQMA